MTTRDWKSFTDVTGEATFLQGQRHGTVVSIPARVAKKLSENLSK
jgi:hypothetical protein